MVGGEAAAAACLCLVKRAVQGAYRVLCMMSGLPTIFLDARIGGPIRTPDAVMLRVNALRRRSPPPPARIFGVNAPGAGAGM